MRYWRDDILACIISGKFPPKPLDPSLSMPNFPSIFHSNSTVCPLTALESSSRATAKLIILCRIFNFGKLIGATHSLRQRCAFHRPTFSVSVCLCLCYCDVRPGSLGWFSVDVPQFLCILFWTAIKPEMPDVSKVSANETQVLRAEPAKAFSCVIYETEMEKRERTRGGRKQQLNPV